MHKIRNWGIFDKITYILQQNYSDFPTFRALYNELFLTHAYFSRAWMVGDHGSWRKSFGLSDLGESFA